MQIIDFKTQASTEFIKPLSMMDQITVLMLKITPYVYSISYCPEEIYPYRKYQSVTDL